MKRTLHTCCVMLFLIPGCMVSQQKLKPVPRPGNWSELIYVKNTSGTAESSVPIRIYFPKNFTHNGQSRTIIALHSYGGSCTDWGSKTSIEKFADAFSIAVVCPEMKGTSYEMHFYPETKNKWNPVPGGKWVVKQLIPFLRENYGLARIRNKTGIVGVSMGARGAFLIACTYPQIFGHAICMSGFYDSLVLTSNSTLTDIYGPFEKFQERWTRDDNTMKLSKNLKNTKLLIIHGGKDNQYPIEQSRLIIIRLTQLQQKSRGDYVFQYIEKRRQRHTWSFWASNTESMMIFLDTHMDK